MSVNGTLVEDEMRRIEGECAHFSFNKCPIYTHGGASAKFSINSHATDYSACILIDMLKTSLLSFAVLTFMCDSAYALIFSKFVTCTVVSVNGTLVEDKMRRIKGECAHFSFNKFPFTLTAVQVPNLALTHTPRITVHVFSLICSKHPCSLLLFYNFHVW